MTEPPSTTSPSSTAIASGPQTPPTSSAELQPPSTPPPGEPPAAGAHLKASPIGPSSYYSSSAHAAIKLKNTLAKARREGKRISMYGKTCMLELEEFMTRHVPAPVDIREPEELFTWTPTKPIRPENSQDKGASCINAWLKHADNDDNRREAGPDAAEGYEVVVTANKVDPLDSTRQRCDLALYPAYSAPTDREEGANWAAIEVLFECKPDAGQDDPFDENAEMFEPFSDRRKENLGQIMSYATLIFTRQHRAHLFTVVLLGNMARIIHWDHSGLTVTKKFNYHREPIKLSRFLWRLCHLSAAQRGHDPTVTRVLSRTDEDQLIEARAEQPIMEQGFEIGQHARLMFKDTITSKKERYKISVNGRNFLVGRPHFESSELAGRGTRGYVAIDCDNPHGPFVYLKDAWRVAHDGIEPEGETLAYLNNDAIHPGKIEGVPTLVCHGDVGDQQTTTQDVWKALHPDAAQCPLKTHRHYRIVVQEVGLSMECFENAAELVWLIVSCIMAHQRAYDKGVVHRDVSAGNVLIHVRESVEDGKLVQERVGLLTDWELSKRKDAPNIARQPDRTGTWQFMPVYILDNPSEPICIADEIEAFFHVLLFFAVRYLPHNITDVGDFMHKYFDGFENDHGEFYCGEKKRSAMYQGRIEYVGGRELVFYLPPTSTIHANDAPGAQVENQDPSVPGSHPLNGLIAQLLRLFQARYALLKDAKSSARPTGPQPTNEPLVAQDKVALLHKRFSGVLATLKQAAPSQKRARPLTPEQRAELEELAEQLNSHDTICGMLAQCFSTIEETLLWPPNDTVPDQLPKNYRPKNDTPRGLSSQTATGSKRAAMEDEAEREYPDTKRHLRSSGKTMA